MQVFSWLLYLLLCLLSAPESVGTGSIPTRRDLDQVLHPLSIRNTQKAGTDFVLPPVSTDSPAS